MGWGEISVVMVRNEAICAPRAIQPKPLELSLRNLREVEAICTHRVGFVGWIEGVHIVFTENASAARNPTMNAWSLFIFARLGAEIVICGLSFFTIPQPDR